MNFHDEKQLMSYFGQQIIHHRANNGWCFVPHLVMSHGFMEWTKLLVESFPSMAWRGQDREEVDGEYFEDYMVALFKRFWIRLMQEDLDLTEEQQDYLLEEGWKEFMND